MTFSHARHFPRVFLACVFSQCACVWVLYGYDMCLFIFGCRKKPPASFYLNANYYVHLMLLDFELKLPRIWIRLLSQHWQTQSSINRRKLAIYRKSDCSILAPDMVRRRRQSYLKYQLFHFEFTSPDDSRLLDQGQSRICWELGDNVC